MRLPARACRETFLGLVGISLTGGRAAIIGRMNGEEGRQRRPHPSPVGVGRKWPILRGAGLGGSPLGESSTFLGLLLRVNRRTNRRVAATTAQVVRVLELTGADQVLDVRATLDDAVTE